MVLNDALLLLILRYAEEEADGARPIREPTFDEYSRQQIRYHIGMCRQAGWLTVHQNGKQLRSVGLTWDGQQHLKQHRDG